MTTIPPMPTVHYPLPDKASVYVQLDALEALAAWGTLGWAKVQELEQEISDYKVVVWGKMERCKELEANLEETEGLRDYARVCPSCEATHPKGYPPMDEDGCCATCGADCSVAGMAERTKEVEAERDKALAQSAALQAQAEALAEALEKCLADLCNPFPHDCFKAITMARSAIRTYREGR